MTKINLKIQTQGDENWL